ncbi:MAG: hypothetical protein DMG08_28445, partial [Acidobacteria bacterium]
PSAHNYGVESFAHGRNSSIEIADFGLPIADCGFRIEGHAERNSNRDIKQPAVGNAKIHSRSLNPKSAIRNPKSAIRNQKSEQLMKYPHSQINLHWRGSRTLPH